MDIRQALLAEHSKRQTMAIVEFIGDDPKRFAGLMKLFFAGEYRLTQRAAWPMNYCAERHLKLILPYLPKLLDCLERDDMHDAVMRNVMRLLLYPVILIVLGIGLFSSSGCVFVRGQRYHNFTTGTPLKEKQALVLGFLGGRESWNNPRRNVRKLALKLRAQHPDAVQVETVENKKRRLALELIRRAFDRDQDGQLDARERAGVRLILYGHSFGGAAVVKLARELDRMGVPVLLTVQVDSVGRGDQTIPANVARAANLFQRDGLMIRGEPEIRAEDPSRTVVIGNFEFDYRNKKIDLSEASRMKKIFRSAHTRMDFDPAVWALVEELIVKEVTRLDGEGRDRTTVR